MTPQAILHRLSWIVLGLVGLIAASVSVFAFAAEQSHLFAGGGSRAERVSAFASGARQVGLSTTTQRWFVIDCRNSTIYAFTDPVHADMRDEVPRQCLEGALEIVEQAPVSSFAWFGAAHASLALQNWDDMNLYLAHSHATGANEGWIARYRAELVADNFSRVSPDNQNLFRQDLTLLAQNMLAYSGFLGSRYVARPELRTILTEIVETMPPDSQRRFLAAVRRFSEQAQGQS